MRNSRGNEASSSRPRIICAPRWQTALEITSAPYLVWYAAYLSESADEAERIRAWIGEADVWPRPAEAWFEARVAALRGDAATARTLAEEAKTLYRAEVTDAFGFAFEIDHLDRLIASLPLDAEHGVEEAL